MRTGKFLASMTTGSVLIIPPRPLSQDVTEFYDITETLKERLLEARYCAEEERTMKSLDSLLNHILVGVSS